MKFCKDCKHFQEYRCLHDSAAGKPTPVYGLVDRKDPWVMRDETGLCGPDAKLFEEIPPPPPPVRYCEDCRWMIPADYEDKRARIEHAKCGKTSLVGRGIGESYCSTQRMFDDCCGKDAKWFEPRPPGSVLFTEGSVLFTESPPAPWWKFW